MSFEKPPMPPKVLLCHREGRPCYLRERGNHPVDPHATLETALSNHLQLNWQPNVQQVHPHPSGIVKVEDLVERTLEPLLIIEPPSAPTHFINDPRAWLSRSTPGGLLHPFAFFLRITVLFSFLLCFLTPLTAHLGVGVGLHALSDAVVLRFSAWRGILSKIKNLSFDVDFDAFRRSFSCRYGEMNMRLDENVGCRSKSSKEILSACDLTSEGKELRRRNRTI